MTKQRIATRIMAGLLTAGILAVGAVAPAQADTGWNKVANPDVSHPTPVRQAP
jgi:hypothetical protein